jgi:nucleoside-diphosphate-sugar epimerase
VILVTGATGCLGSNLVRRLVEDGERVAILRLPDDKAQALGELAGAVEHRIGDVRDPEAVRRALAGVTHVYHLAGIASSVNAHARAMYSVNVMGTGTVMRAAHRAGVDRVVHTSSTIAVGIPNSSTPVDESFAYNGAAFNHVYATTKHLGELVVRREAADGLDVVIVSPSAVMAPGGSLRYSWAALVLAARRGWLRVYPSGGLAMTPGIDVVDAHARAMARGRCGERYIVASHNLTYAELGRLLATTLGVRPPRRRLPDAAVAAVGIAGSAAARLRRPENAPVLSRENARLMTRTMFYDQSKGMRELGLSVSALEPAALAVDRWCREQRR